MSAQPQSFPQATPERIMQFTWGFVPTLALGSALHKGIFDALDQPIALTYVDGASLDAALCGTPRHGSGRQFVRHFRAWL